MTQGKNIIVKPGQYAQEIPETTLVKGKPYQTNNTQN